MVRLAKYTIDFCRENKKKFIFLPKSKTKGKKRDIELKNYKENLNLKDYLYLVKGIRKKNGFSVEGSKYSGLVEGNPATTSYFSPEFLKRKTWISTQDGDPLSVSATKIGPDMAKTTNGEIPATLWKISGDLDLDLLYAKDGKWLGSRFYAGGSQAEFLLQKSEGNMHSLWKV